MKILISSNCQTYGLAAAMSAMCEVPPPVCIQNIGTPAETLRKQLACALASADVFVYSQNNSIAIELAAAIAAPQRVVRTPVIAFHAFHPDICYAYHRETKQFTRENYNSTIALWAFFKGLPPERAARLYCHEVYEALGYLSAWDAAYRQMQSAFEDSDLNFGFREFYLAVKRSGCFMHTINHPGLPVLIHLSKLLARHLGIPIRREISPGELNDNLNGQIWPIYPEIAETLGLEGGSYTWKYVKDNRYIEGVGHYLEEKFRDYRENGHTPETLQFVPSTAQFIDSMEHADSILRKFA
jgi:hypothetical protein